MKHLARFLTVFCSPRQRWPLSPLHTSNCIEPPSAIVERDNGDPQKMAPCGGNSANPPGDCRRSRHPEQHRHEGSWGIEAAPESPGNRLPSRSLPGGAGGEFACRTSQGSRSDNAGLCARAPVGIGGHSESGSTTTSGRWALAAFTLGRPVLASLGNRHRPAQHQL